MQLLALLLQAVLQRRSLFREIERVQARRQLHDHRVAPQRVHQQAREPGVRAGQPALERQVRLSRQALLLAEPEVRGVERRADRPHVRDHLLVVGRVDHRDRLAREAVDAGDAGELAAEVLADPLDLAVREESGGVLAEVLAGHHVGHVLVVEDGVGHVAVQSQRLVSPRVP